MVRSRVFWLLVSLALAGCGTTEPHHGRWNPNGGPPRDENWHSPAQSLMRYDSNHDGILKRAELLAGLKAEFDAYDTKHDNCLPPDEVRAINQQRVQQDASQATPLVDWNEDGCVDFHEFSETLLSLFDTLDTKGTGQLTEKDINPPTAGPHKDNPAAGENGGHHGHGHDHGGGQGGDGQ